MDTVSSNAVQHRIIYHIIIGQIQLSLQKPNNKINGFQDHYSTFIGSITQPINQSINQPTNEKEQTLVVKGADSTVIGSITQPISQSIIPPSEQVSQPFMIH